jgi:hypothetical protein
MWQLLPGLLSLPDAELTRRYEDCVSTCVEKPNRMRRDEDPEAQIVDDVGRSMIATGMLGITLDLEAGTLSSKTLSINNKDE